MNEYDKKHLHNLTAIERAIQRIFMKAAEDAARIGMRLDAKLAEGSKAFSFTDYPSVKPAVEKLMRQLKEQLEVAVVDGVKSAWTLANNKNDALSRRVFGDNVGKLTPAQYRRYFSTNAQALEAFLARKTEGLSLSDRVWNYTNAFREQIELGLEVGIRSGTASAGQMAEELKQWLVHPDKLFRRVRDAEGLLHLSSRAKAFHPGRGVYRSSYMNARRLAATETNTAYRTADHLRWQQMDFVVGIEICLSNNHTVRLQPGETTDDPAQLRKDGTPKANAVRPLHDICDELKGRYPKSFKFTGWHPHCRCYAVTILKTDEELDRDTERILDGKEPMEGSANEVKDVPEGFRKWVEKNNDRIKGARSLPYFVRDNKDFIAQKRNSKEKAKCTVEELIAKSIGAPIGEPMTHEQANTMRPNPHYAIGEQYRVNCQSCVVTYEMRRRGIDAETVPNFKEKDSVTDFLSRYAYKAWRDAKVIIARPTVKKRTVDRLGRVKITRSSAMDIWNDDILPQLEVGGRYHISWGWKDKDSGHIITMEKLESGKVRLYDPQTGKNYSTPKGIWYEGKRCRINTEVICFYRVDNLAPDGILVERVLFKKGSKPILGTVRKSPTNGITSADKPDNPAPSIFSQRKQWLKEDNFQPQDKERFDNMRGILKRTGLSRKNVINHLYSKEELEAAEYIWKNPHMLKYKSSGKLGEVKDLTKEKDIENIKKKAARNVVQYNLYEFEYNGKTWRIKTEENKDGNEAFYSLVK